MLCSLDDRYASAVSEYHESFGESLAIILSAELELLYLHELLNELPSDHPLFMNKKAKEDILVAHTAISKNKKEFVDKVKIIEQKTKHDLKAIEFALRDYLPENLHALVHIGLTSEDIKSPVFTGQCKAATIKFLNSVYKLIDILKPAEPDASILGMTHGQPATPISYNKTVIDLYRMRLERAVANFSRIQFFCKFGGATGNFAAHKAMNPQVNWENFSDNVISKLGMELVRQPISTQVDDKDWLANLLSAIANVMRIVVDLAGDFWQYFSRGIVTKKTTDEEVGSSVMPQKVNPIAFENAEGHAKKYLGCYNVFADEATRSLMQRDLKNSCILRDVGILFGWAGMAIHSLTDGLSQVVKNEVVIQQELEEHPEVILEIIQTKLRLNGVIDAYTSTKLYAKHCRLTGTRCTEEGYYEWSNKGGTVHKDE